MPRAADTVLNRRGGMHFGVVLYGPDNDHH